MVDYILDLQNVSKTYGQALAVNEVSIRVREGEFLTFLGPSGSGKTTTLMMIAGLQVQSGGQILLRGNPIAALPPYRRNIGMVFQHYALFPHLTTAQNVAFPLQMRRLDDATITQRVNEALTLVGLQGLGERYPSQLSGGQQQRVALARATVYKPSILLMDEPLGALDKNLRAQMQGEIMALHKKLGISILYVTHDQEEALVMSDRIAIFKGGSVEQIGTPSQLYEMPSSAFVANFIGETNFIPAVVFSKAGNYVDLDTPLGRLRTLSQDVELGAHVNLAVRPERIHLSSVPIGGAPRIRGIVEEQIYLGQGRKYRVSLQGGVTVSVLLPPSSEYDALPSRGAEVFLSWELEHSRLLCA